jgi:hypothetical protein
MPASGPIVMRHCPAPRRQSPDRFAVVATVGNNEPPVSLREGDGPLGEQPQRDS